MKIFKRFVDENNAFLEYQNRGNKDSRNNKKALFNSMIVFIIMSTIVLGIGTVFDLYANITYLILSLNTVLFCSLLFYLYKALYDNGYENKIRYILIIKAVNLLVYQCFFYLLLTYFIFWEFESLITVLIAMFVLMLSTVFLFLLERKEFYFSSRMILSALMNAAVSYITFAILLRLGVLRSVSVENTPEVIITFFIIVILVQLVSYNLGRIKIPKKQWKWILVVAGVHVALIYPLGWLDFIVEESTRNLHTEILNFEKSESYEDINPYNIDDPNRDDQNFYKSVLFEQGDYYYYLVRHRVNTSQNHYEFIIFDKELNIQKREVFNGQDLVQLGYINDKLYFLQNDTSKDPKYLVDLYMYEIDGLNRTKTDIGLISTISPHYENVSFYIVEKDLRLNMAWGACCGTTAEVLYDGVTGDIFVQDEVDQLDLDSHYLNHFIEYDEVEEQYIVLTQSRFADQYDGRALLYDDTVVVTPNTIHDVEAYYLPLDDYLNDDYTNRVDLENDLSDIWRGIVTPRGLVIKNDNIFIFNGTGFYQYSMTGEVVNSLEIDKFDNNLTDFDTFVTEDAILLVEHDKSIHQINLENPVSKVFGRYEAIGYGEISLLALLVIFNRKSALFG